MHLQTADISAVIDMLLFVRNRLNCMSVDLHIKQIIGLRETRSRAQITQEEV